jgi:hypothetical protein
MKPKRIRSIPQEQSKATVGLDVFDPVVHEIALDIFDVNSRYITLDAPPGSGKTASIVSLVRYLQKLSHELPEFTVIVASPTRSQVIALGNRLCDSIKPEFIEMSMSAKTGDGSIELRDYIASKKASPDSIPMAARNFRVVLTTISRMSLSYATEPECHVLIVDEAYQAKSGDLSRFWNVALKAVFVGDPGQIGPVITAPANIWQGTNRQDPTMRLQDAVKRNNNNVRNYHLVSTWRLGGLTTEIVNTLYDFSFSSKRPDRHVLLNDRQLAEIEIVDTFSPSEIDKSEIPIFIARHIASRCKDLLQSGEIVEGNTVRRVKASDIAIVATVNSLVDTARLALVEAQIDGAGISVVTADSAQGKEWPIVIALDPLGVASLRPSDHHTATGRLAVMLSRHNNHLTWYGYHVDDLDIEDLTERGVNQLNISVRKELSDKAPIVDEVFSW